MFLRRLIHVVLSLTISLCLPLEAMEWPQNPSLTASLITPSHAQAIYRHIVESHWVPETGLFLSFPDSADKKLSQQGATYEEAAAGLLALRLGDVDRAHGIFRFFKQAWVEGPQKTGSPRYGVHGLTNFYNAQFGTEGIEKTIHTGPNAWAGLFAARLGNLTRDPEALRWAMDVAYWIANGIPHQNGAVAMGPKDDPHGAPWTKVYSTENNLSYYAMLTELLRWPLMDQAQRVALTEERDRVENWLLNTAFDRSTYRLLRGVNPQGSDTVQALDTVTWMISAIGPAKLAVHGIDPHRLMRRAEKSFEVKVAGHDGVDPADQVEADFTFLHDRPENSAQPGRPAANQHRMIWYEGLGQYILALGAMAAYAQRTGRPEVAQRYLEKAKELTQQFDLAALKDTPEAARYPYATPGKFFRDGWRTPVDGPSGPASSLISATWRCFAGLGMDPVAGQQVAAIQTVEVSASSHIALAQRKPAILYGTSEDMLQHAWQAVNHRDLDIAISQAEATIQEWQPWAAKLQQKKMTEVGRLLDYNGSALEQQKIFSYWALNDVGAAYFILGKAWDEKGDYNQAARAFQQIAQHYSLAQVWDPQGWFWAPMDAVVNDYVSRDPAHYGGVLPQILAEGSTVGKRPY